MSIFDRFVGARVAVSLSTKNGIPVKLTGTAICSFDCCYFEGKLTDASPDFGCIRLNADMRADHIQHDTSTPMDPTDLIIPIHNISGIERLE